MCLLVYILCLSARQRRVTSFYYFKFFVVVCFKLWTRSFHVLFVFAPPPDDCWD